ncbi:hypothetical protein BGZ54_005297, partial [Gamsiella multidivaricata]
MQSGNSRNPQHDRPDDGGMANAKKLKPTGGILEPSQPVRAAEATTSAALPNPGGPSGTALPPTVAIIYSSKMGLKAMNAKQHEDVAEAVAMEDESMEQEAQEEWIEVQRARDRFFAASIHLDSIHGNTAAEKKSELQDILLRASVHCTEGPSRIKLPTGEAAFRIAVETQSELDMLLRFEDRITLEDGTTEKYSMFTRMDNTRREAEQERTIEVYGLHPLTDDFRIKSAMARYGVVEKIITRPCKNGIKITARVIFEDVQV